MDIERAIISLIQTSYVLFCLIFLVGIILLVDDTRNADRFGTKADSVKAWVILVVHLAISISVIVGIGLYLMPYTNINLGN